MVLAAMLLFTTAPRTVRAAPLDEPAASAAGSDSTTTVAAALPAALPPAAEAMRRPPALVPLYVSFAALQVLDVHSTLTSIDGGAREGNAAMAGLVGSPATFAAVKMAAAAGIVLITERVRVHHPAAALALMIGLNGVYAGVVAHNYSIAR